VWATAPVTWQVNQNCLTFGGVKPLTREEKIILSELCRLAGPSRTVTSAQLNANNFADFVIEVRKSEALYPQSIQSTTLQKLRDKGYITMNKGLYTILAESG
jgi:hypothetical protein